MHDQLVTTAIHVTIDLSSRTSRVAAWLRPMDKTNLAQHGHEQTCECRSLWERLRLRHMQAAGCSRLFGTAQSVSPNQTFYCAVLDLVLLSSKRTFHNHTVSRRSMHSLFSKGCLQELRRGDTSISQTVADELQYQVASKRTACTSFY
jgi:hypothetical protein